ncbi:MAG: hypothetical protein Q9214_001885 [Letrouitia sp. 1 TL-2023]
MKLSQPTPYGASSLNNSPLAADGSDFPCKQRSGVYDAEGANNIMPIGSTQKLKFLGGATHGGGSCQIALTKDLEPTKDSQWMVIQSIVGGCPSAAAGNLNDNAASTGASEFPYTIPQGIAAGKYTLAWTWFNKIGNREMYMNCAPVTVTGGSKRRDVNETEQYTTDEVFAKRENKFPNLFKANIGNGCTTADSEDLQFPNPGESVSKAGAGSASGSGSGSPSAAAPSPAATSVIAIPPEGAPGSSAPSAAAPVASQAAPASTGSASSSSGSGNASGSTGSTGSTASTTCSSPGSEVCSPDGTQIGQCDQSGHVVFMAVAPGTKCQGGQMVHAKRSARFAHGYVRRSQALGRW